jgi:hypothetical protein
MTPPENFTPSKQFPGFIKLDDKASIVVTTVSGPYSKVTAGFNIQGLASKKMKLIDKSNVTLGTENALYLKVSQVAYGEEYLKMIVICGDELETVLMVASYPKTVAGKLEQPLKNSLLSARWDKERRIDFFEGLTFRIKETGGLRIATKMGNNLVLTLYGKFPTVAPTDPVFIAGASLTENYTIPEHALFANKRLKQTQSIKNLEVISEGAVNIDNLKGWKILAKAVDLKTDITMFVYQVLLFNQEGYYIFQGYVDYDEMDKYKEIFETISQSFKRR